MSDSNMRGNAGLVVGTAGHVDHGKTSLIYALTGIDTDRLKEEKQRGISIDLGFAQMELANGQVISFVDVPGHERFVRNMLAGAAGIEAVLLIVAANESVMPQTREHFEICKLLGIRQGVIVLTKSDLATPEQLAATRADIRNLVAGSFLDDAPIIDCSAASKQGLNELEHALAKVAMQGTKRDCESVMRMPIDRAFAVKGFGTVVTGTLLAGSVSVGETVEVHPLNTKVRVRGLQTKHAAVEQAMAGQRLAMNIAGVDHQDIKRGYVIAAAGALTDSRILDVELHWLNQDVLPSARELFILHAGTAEISVKITLYPPGFARLRLSQELIVLPGDRFVIRRPSPAETVGGGIVLDAFPPRRLARFKTLNRLKVLAGRNLLSHIQLVLDEASRGLSLADLTRMTGASRSQLQKVIKDAGTMVITTDERVVKRSWILEKQQALVSWLSEFHKANPNAAGAPFATARMGLDAALASVVIKNFAAIRIQGDLIALANHKVAFSAQELEALQKIESAFRAGAFQPPATADVIAGAGLDSKKARGLLEALIKSNRLVKLPDDLVFHADVISHIRTSLAQHKGRRFSVAEFKSWINISRKFAIPLLEYLDQQRITRREGEFRVVL